MQLTEARAEASKRTGSEAPPPPVPAKGAGVYRGRDTLAWLSILGDRDIATRREAALALVSLGAGDIDNARAAVVQRAWEVESDELTRARLTWLLCQVKPEPRYIDALHQIIKLDGDAQHFTACAEAATILGLIGPPAAAALPTIEHFALQYGQDRPSAMLQGFPELRAFGLACRKAFSLIDPPEQGDEGK